MKHSSSAYLFAWSPSKWPWPELPEQSRLVSSGGRVTERWTCASHKKIKPGDRAFVVKVGGGPRGIFASGYVTSEPFIGKGRRGQDIHCVMVELDVLLDPATTPILTVELLRMGKMEKQMWTPQSSGISIKEELVEELELLWQDFLENGTT